MVSISGRGLIADFDGTIAHLPVEWAYLRRSLGVGAISDLWEKNSTQAWAAVTSAEVQAAAVARATPSVLGYLLARGRFAILTGNSERAVSAFLNRFASLRNQVVCIVGRETLQGPKSDFSVFTRGFAICVATLPLAKEGGPITYLADQLFELEFARRLGALGLHPSALKVP
jgi:hypothetical protein